MAPTGSGGNPPSSGGFGIEFDGATDGLIENNTLVDNHIGIYIRNSASRNIISNNTANSGIRGIQTASNSDNNNISSNTFNTNRYGILIFSDFNEIRDNVVDASTDISFDLTNGDNNIVINDTYTNNGAGDTGAIWIWNSDHNRFINVTVNDSLNNAI